MVKNILISELNTRWDRTVCGIMNANFSHMRRRRVQSTGTARRVKQTRFHLKTGTFHDSLLR